MTKNKGIAGATLEGIKGFFRRGAKYSEAEMDVEGKSCLITGANSGLGKGIATRLATLGAHITMAGRTMDEDAKNEIVHMSNNSNVGMEKLDLASFQSVLNFCQRMKRAEQHFDIVILNAAVVSKSNTTTGDCLDTMTQVNFLSNVLLIETLLHGDRIAANGRIVVVSSEAHRWTESIDIATVGAPKVFKMKDAMKQYSDTKFLMATYTAHLARRLQHNDSTTHGGSIAVHAHCPGAVNSNLAREAPTFLQPLLKLIFLLFFASPHKASRPAVHLACSPALEGKTGLYYHLMTPKPFDVRTLDPRFQEELFARANQIIKNGTDQPTTAAPSIRISR